MITRRSLLKGASVGAALVVSGVRFPQLSEAEAASLNLPGELPEGTRADAILHALPGKKPLIKLTYRPPNYETPIEYLRSAITPNDAFYVRYHLSDIPQVDAKTGGCPSAAKVPMRRPSSLSTTCRRCRRLR